MGQPSTEASNAIIYVTYGFFLYDLTHNFIVNYLYEVILTDLNAIRMLGTGMAWKLSRHQSKGDFLAGNRTQSG